MKIDKPILILFYIIILYFVWHFGRWYEYRQMTSSFTLNKIIIFKCIHYIEPIKTQINTIIEYIPSETLYEEFEISAYCTENYPHICNDGDSTKTATNTTPIPGRTIAVDPKIIPYGTKIYIDGMGLYIAEDSGGSIKGNKIDIVFETHDEALKFGRKKLKTWILQD